MMCTGKRSEKEGGYGGPNDRSTISRRLEREGEMCEPPGSTTLSVKPSLVCPNIAIYGVDGSSMTQGSRTPSEAADWLWERSGELDSRFEFDG